MIVVISACGYNCSMRISDSSSNKHYIVLTALTIEVPAMSICMLGINAYNRSKCRNSRKVRCFQPTCVVET